MITPSVLVDRGRFVILSFRVSFRLRGNSPGLRVILFIRGLPHQSADWFAMTLYFMEEKQ